MINEKQISEFWEKNNIFRKSVEQRPKDKQYVFYDGPPFATGLPQYGNMLGLISKDLFPRFWTMKGFRVERRWGWDCHGLPIESLAEEELGIKDKKEIEVMGVDKFNEFCRSKVLYFATEWKKTVTRLGKWIEFDNAYKTMDTSYMESVWHIFKTLYDDGYIYEGKKVLMYCPKCQTPLANAEIQMDNSYKDVTEKTATVSFKLKDEDTYLLAWTTTPWTLIGNVAIAINEDLFYVKIKLHNKYYIIAKDRLETIKQEYEIVEEFKGDRLVHKEYEQLYEHETDKKGFYVINGGDQVTAEEGTGLVHMAIYGEFDYEKIKEYDLPIIQHVGLHGKLIAGPKEWKDTWFKKSDALVLEDLEKRGLLFAAEHYTHSYPFCYRCETPLFYNAVDSWFINIQKIKKRLLEKNEDINWVPSHLKHGRFKHIIETAPDWSISRNRFWATAIPVWKCTSCDHLEVFGSIKDLQEKAIGTVPDNVDLHKHVIDKVHVKCSSCQGTMDRVPEVLDCWMESASMPYAAQHYPFENKEWFAHNFPGDFISEYIAQVRTWFYYTHAIGVLLFDKAPFKNVLVTGTILARDGSKMSKSKRNFSDPEKLFDAYGADSLRFYLMSSPLMKAQDLNFKDELVREIFRKVIMILKNISSFYSLCGSENQTFDNDTSDHILDQWIISKTHLLMRDVTQALEAYNTVLACKDLTAFIDDVSTWYVRRSRDRCKSTDENEKRQAIQTLGFILMTLSKLMAPITPFIAEDMYQGFRKMNNMLEESVHLEKWPSYDNNKIKKNMHKDMILTREAVSKALDQRDKAKIPVRQPLTKVTVTGLYVDGGYLELMKQELNVKEIALFPGDEISVVLDTTMTPELILEGISRDVMRKVNGYRKEKKLTIQDKINLYVDTENQDIKEGIEKYKEEIKKNTQAKEIIFEIKPSVVFKELVIHKEKVKVGIEVL